MPESRIAVIGTGRMGRGLALALERAARPVALLGREREPGAWSEAVRDADTLVIAVPDTAIGDVAGALADGGVVGPEHIVLHLSGLLDRGALVALEESGAGLGSLHPLQTVADPATAPERLRGAYAAVEGDARAVAAAEALARAVGMTPVPVPAAGKPLYHAAAAIAANYTVVLVGVAERLAVRAGIAPELAGKLFVPLLEGAARNIAELGPAAALTGPIRRGDVRTIFAHLAALDPDDQHLYGTLGCLAVALARDAGLDPSTARLIEAVFNEEP
ncbi:MAG TPA: DUF2520 domain-containing protein [Gemmatimonadales bacterium]|nr:DUF2520 domain-containing protein [Gemmatimonadales bacterium]